MRFPDFNNYIDKLLVFEGELSNHPQDHGGLTKYGISKKAFPEVDIARLREEDAKDIYFKYYWVPARCSDLPQYLRFIHFDTAVNMGVATANKILQKAIGNIMVDGVFGQITFENAHKCTLAMYTAERAAKYASIVVKDPSQLVFLIGWMNRLKQVVR